MSTKHNTKHAERGTSNYPARLTARGLAKAPEMESLEDLRKRQNNRVKASCTITHNHNVIDCNGVPFLTPRAVAIEDGLELAKSGREEELLMAIFSDSDVA